ncbi:MAG: hypothetical protein IJ816_05410 [Alloprevotella sp.]|nr:hypothetical protein [Alloprevotella sp.]
MKRFIKHYALEIYTVLALLFITSTALMDGLSFVQKLLIFDALIFVFHEWEEGHYPGGFTNLIGGLIHVEVSNEMKRASRIPAGILLLLLSIVPFVCHDMPLFTMMVVTFGFIESFVHTMGIRLFRTKHFYTPGMITALIEGGIGLALLVYLINNHLGTWPDYVFGPLLMFVCFATLQKIETLLVGIHYSDMPKYIRQQWKRK